MPSDHVLHEKVHQHAELRLFQTLDARNKLAIDEEAPLSRYWMHTHQRVNRVDGVLSHHPTAQVRMSDHFGR